MPTPGPDSQRMTSHPLLHLPQAVVMTPSPRKRSKYPTWRVHSSPEIVSKLDSSMVNMHLWLQRQYLRFIKIIFPNASTILFAITFPPQKRNFLFLSPQSYLFWRNSISRNSVQFGPTYFCVNYLLMQYLVC